MTEDNKTPLPFDQTELDRLRAERDEWKELATEFKGLTEEWQARAEGVPPSDRSGGSWQREHEALGELIRLLDEEPSIGDAEMSDALEKARCAWDHSRAPSPASDVAIANLVLECLKDARSKLTDDSEIDLGYIDDVIASAELNGKQNPTPSGSFGVQFLPAEDGEFNGNEHPEPDLSALEEIKYLACTAGAPCHMPVPKALARILTLCNRAGVTKKLDDLRPRFATTEGSAE